MRKSFIAKLVAKPEKAADLEALQIELRALVHLHEPDCEIYELFKATDMPNTYFCVATFKSCAPMVAACRWRGPASSPCR